MTETTTREEWTDVGIHHVTYRDTVGRLHRKDGPAVTDTWPDGYRREAWYWRDKRHRKDGPAVTATFPDGSQQCEWWEDGVFIREKVTPAPKDSDEANVASTWKQERDEAVGHLREVVRTYRNADSDGVLAYSDVLGGAIDAAAAWLDAHKAADDD